jgi:ATP-binding protein involved in chromosome partitioning
MDVFGAGGGERLAEQSGVPFIGSIPLDPAVRQGGDQGVPVVISHPDSPVSHALKAIAEDIAAKISVAAMQKSDIIPISMIG